MFVSTLKMVGNNVNVNKSLIPIIFHVSHCNNKQSASRCRSVRVL